MKKIILISLLLLFPLITNADTSINIGIGIGTGSGGSGGWGPGALSATGLPAGSIYEIIYNFLYWLLAIFGALAIIGFVIAGVMYILSAGDDDMMKKAKNYMIYCIIGVVVALSGLVIIYAISSALSGASNF
jgi:hypothetical protein